MAVRYINVLPMPYGYHGKMLKVDLNSQRTSIDNLNDEDAKKYVGGTGFGAKVLYEEVPPGVQWNDPENRIIIATGPLSGTIFPGSGSFTLVTKCPATNLAVDTQANGFLGAFLKLSGLDGLVIHGQSKKWCYLFVRDGELEFRDADHLIGTDTFEAEERIKKEIENDHKLGTGNLSVYSIGPAGENLVRFAAFVGDHGHVCSKGGNGAVLGAKRLKAIAVARGNHKTPVKDEQALTEIIKEHWAALQNDPSVKTYINYGTAGLVTRNAKVGLLPVRNFTTSVFPAEHVEKLTGEYMRTHFEQEKTTCWACRIAHTRYTKITEGSYKGVEGEEPEYETIAAFGPQIWQMDPEATIMLGDLADRLGLDVNESGWVLGFVMECYEKGILTDEDLKGIKPNWGATEEARKLLNHIAMREGIGKLLAEGVKRSAERIGGEALNIGVYTLKGVTPRGHDHRARWTELFDSCTTNTSTIESVLAGPHPSKLVGGEDINMFDPEQVARANAKYNGWSIFENSLGICRFCISSQYKTLLKAVNAVTGWSLGVEDALTIGKRTVNLLHAFNLGHGLNPETEKPSPRYGSTPTDGPAEGINIMKHFDKMLRIYRKEMGWDEETGKPLPETLRKYQLDFVTKSREE